MTYMRHTPNVLLVLLILSASFVHAAVAQRINFGAYTTSVGLSLMVGGNLNFKDKEPIIVSGSNQTVSINFNDNETQCVSITGDATRDVFVSISAPLNLITGVGGPGNEIPFNCKFAYSNLGSGSVAAAKMSAIQVPSGFTSASFPLLRRASGAPLPPPTPAHSGYTAPSATAYLFIYGSLGPVGNVTPSNNYTGTINVTVQYQ